VAQPYVEPCSVGIISTEPFRPQLARVRRRRIVLAACVVASSMAYIDGSALTVALPKLRASLGVDLAAVQWVVNAYVIAFAALTLIGGALADAYGRSRVLSIGCLLFGLASVACAIAPSAAWLIAARVVQGIAAAIVAPASLALIGATYPKDERNRAIGVWAAASALTTAGGPVLGGWLTDAFGWQAVFWINPPFALIAVGLLIAAAPGDLREPRRFDAVGAVLLAAALSALAWGLSQVGSNERQVVTAASSASNTTIAMAATLCVAGFVAYGLWERVTESPMTPPRLVRNRAFFGLNLATLMIYAGLSIVFFLLPFDLVDRRGLPATEAGAVFLPFTLGVGLLSRLFGGMADSIGPRTMLIAGPLAAALAYFWMALEQQSSLIFGVLGPMTLLGLSFALLVAPLTASVLSNMDEDDQGLAAGINNAASRIAQLIGIALAAGIAPFVSSYKLGLAIAAALSITGAITIAITVAPRQSRQ
jgi:EmrB/QacA subfamily drug resistance transporter